ncbi:glycosyltransferase family 4 protein [Agriterribacter sp.]|uniref:glycosyltransferase family 4 protein n=1 Tax=Agriterribacter sp. TaxID=2821509 RepID=UPI002CEEBF23|nr:glycosyltransferase family 4 protein [Agriterribacter sp.]HTN07650.1 glycosyltransferase family 4 protein [Agriterribacter sp.]
MTYKQAKVKLAIEQALMSPFILLGIISGFFFPLKTRHNLFLFFPNGDIGGSPRVNIDITQCMKDAMPLIIFSKKPANNQFIEEFNIPGVRIIDLAPYIDNKLFYFVNFFFRGVIATWINKSTDPVLFGGECMFFYKMLPHVKKSAKCVELSHLATWLSYNIGFIDRIDTRIFSTRKLKEQVAQQYDCNKIERYLYEKLLFIDNAVDIPAASTVENDNLEIVFIGRGSPQKRVHLVGAIAKQMHEAGHKAHFSFVGDVEKVINPANYPYCSFLGNISDKKQMEDIYRRSDVLILTSAFEGLPVVIMTMMAYGKVVLSTAVNAIPDYIEHMQNGLLIYETEEREIVNKGVELLRLLLLQPNLKIALGQKNREVAIEKFSRAIFCKQYREILIEKK